MHKEQRHRHQYTEHVPNKAQAGDPLAPVLSAQVTLLYSKKVFIVQQRDQSR
jgi:hypothetical protein